MNGTVTCEPNFLHSFDISTTIFNDITISNTSNASSTSTEQYQQFTSTTSINNSLVDRLSTAVGALLILSVILSFSSFLSVFFSNQPSAKFCSFSSSSMPARYSQLCACVTPSSGTKSLAPMLLYPKSIRNIGQLVSASELGY